VDLNGTKKRNNFYYTTSNLCGVNQVFLIKEAGIKIKVYMKKLIYLASLMALLIVCTAGCGKDKTPTPSSTGTGSAAPGGGTTPGY
jgi:hypothetical protein